ncbi:MAG: [FeFe] hydrogenase H-cluster radical SAM maturase HydE [Endomicrobiia bacterium]
MEKEIFTFEKIEYLYKNVSLEELSKESNFITEKIFSNKIWIRAIIEFSNYCENNCLYCGIRASNKKIKRYSLDDELILKTAKQAIDYGVKTIVLQSGESSFYSSATRICRLVEKIKKLDSEVAVTLSCGYFTKKELIDIRNSGADRYLLRFETADEDLYSFLKNGEPLSKRIEMLHNLRDIGFEVGSGFMVGLPNETDEVAVKNLLLCKELNLDMVGIGPFIPHPDTPLAEAKLAPFEKTLRAVAILRIMLPYSNIPATTAMGTVDPFGREKALQAGANVLMPIITPTEVRKYYLLYPNKICIYENGFECFKCLENRVKKIGKTLKFERGDSLNKKCNLQLQKV